MKGGLVGYGLGLDVLGSVLRGIEKSTKKSDLWKDSD